MRMTVLGSIGVMAVLAAGVLAGCHISGDAFKAKFARSEVLTAPLADITTLDVCTNVGKIEVRPGDVTEIQIAVEIKVKAGSEEKAQELGEGVRIEAEPSGQTLVVKAVKPSGFGRNELVVDFTITVPAALAIKAATNVGDIRVTDFTEPGRGSQRCRQDHLHRPSRRRRSSHERRRCPRGIRFRCPCRDLG